MDVSRLLIAAGLTLWVGGLAGAALYVSRRMRFPKSMFPGTSGGSSGWFRMIAGLMAFAVAAYSVPNVAMGVNLIASGIVPYVLGAYVVALTVERRRAIRLGLPEPGTDGTMSVAESAAFLAAALLFAVAALALTVYGIANEISGNRREGVAGLGFGAGAWFMTFFMGLFASPLIVIRWRRQGPEEPDAPAQETSR